MTDAEHRYAMALLATYDRPEFEVSRVELERPAPSYTVDTLREYRRRFPEAELWFITGADAILEILGWREPEELVRLARFVAVTRPGYPLERLKGVEEALGGAARGRIRTLEVPALAIASRDLRRRVAQGWPIRYLVPAEVARYIEKAGLYRGGGDATGTG
ncbi:MAG: nicotinate (nicotinamide) nucleotide adenylyltransferase [Clostridia bacterium]|nr:nicotinate (nicotinamide) nucleotide adenylyltransferase [Clostridia bacterium]